MDDELRRIYHLIDMNLSGIEYYIEKFKDLEITERNLNVFPYYIADFILAVRALRDKLENG
jgi:hypothetical protein